VLNGVEPCCSRRALDGGGEAVAGPLALRLLGAVCRDEAVAAALACRALVQDIAPNSRAAADLRDVASALLARLSAVAKPSLAAAAELLAPLRPSDRPCLAAAAELLAVPPAAISSGGRAAPTLADDVPGPAPSCAWPMPRSYPSDGAGTASPGPVAAPWRAVGPVSTAASRFAAWGIPGVRRRRGLAFPARRRGTASGATAVRLFGRWDDTNSG
jgi:hypothetical protein